MTKTWRLDDSRQTLVLDSTDGLLAEVIYWGARLPDDENLATLCAANSIDITPATLDRTPALSICPEARRSFAGQPGLVISEADGKPIASKMHLASADQDGKGSLALVYVDAENSLTYQADFRINPRTHIIESRARLEADRPVRLQWLAAPVVPGPQQSEEMIDFAGRWCGEFQAVKTPWSAGIRQRESRTGRTGHEHFPGLIVPFTGATNTQGEAYGFHYGWSGGHRMVAEELPDGRRQIQFGNATNTELAPRTRFETATLYSTYSPTGLNGVAVAFQRHLRDEIVTSPHPARARPVHYNCWEAVYFRHDIQELQSIATRAAELGAERFVLDDGWFRNRSDDFRALGDWDIDKVKYPDGFGPLIDHIHAQGMRFGIWFEPEMVNPDSDLYRAHPDWALGDEDQVTGRNQKVLNIALPKVREYLFAKITAILEAYPVDYIKWDHNRVLPAPDAEQTRSIYALLDRLRAAYPQTEIESCASGGGRIDFGILARTHRVWLSDSNDALERLKIQHNAALFLPLAVTGSHVGPRHCHTSGRVLSMSFRAWVAAERHMGFEMDPRELTPDEAETLKRVTTWWKANRDWLVQADILRLDSPDKSLIAEEQLAADGSRFVAFVGKADTSAQSVPRPLRLTGLMPEARYRVEIVNREDLLPFARDELLLRDGPAEASGQYLMQRGIILPIAFPGSIFVIEGTLLP